MSNSKLVNFVRISSNKTSPRNHKIDTITVHTVAGNLTIEALGALFQANKASSNYGIGTDGRVGMYVEEKDRSWASSNALNDHRAITIEVANNRVAEDWPVSDKAYESLINLLADICKRNKIPKLLWRADRNLIGQVDKQNMTVHRWFANKECPGDFLFDRHHDIAKKVNEKLEGEGVEVSAKMDGEEIIIALNEYFKGKQVPDWAKKDFEEAVQLGITDGFNPTALIPRFQVAIMIKRVFDKLNWKGEK